MVILDSQIRSPYNFFSESLTHLVSVIIGVVEGVKDLSSTVGLLYVTLPKLIENQHDFCFLVGQQNL